LTILYEIDIICLLPPNLHHFISRCYDLPLTFMDLLRFQTFP
jgi:hypothetical protein